MTNYKTYDEIGKQVRIVFFFLEGTVNEEIKFKSKKDDSKIESSREKISQSPAQKIPRLVTRRSDPLASLRFSNHHEQLIKTNCLI